MTKTKKECFFVWRTTFTGAPQAVVTDSQAHSRAWLEGSITDLDPFQGEAVRNWLDLVSLDRRNNRGASCYRPACSNQWVSL